MEKENDKKNKEDSTSKIDTSEKNIQDEIVEEPSFEEKFNETQDKLLRALADSENQRRRSEKETKEAFEYGGFNFAR